MAQINRDTWSHEAVKEMVGSSFVFWQACRPIPSYRKAEGVNDVVVWSRRWAGEKKQKNKKNKQKNRERKIT